MKSDKLPFVMPLEEASVGGKVQKCGAVVLTRKKNVWNSFAASILILFLKKNCQS